MYTSLTPEANLPFGHTIQSAAQTLMDEYPVFFHIEANQKLATLFPKLALMEK